jgi:hypothetical protein
MTILCPDRINQNMAHDYVPAIGTLMHLLSSNRLYGDLPIMEQHHDSVKTIIIYPKVKATKRQITLPRDPLRQHAHQQLREPST